MSSGKNGIPVGFYDACPDFPDCGCMLACDREITDRSRRGIPVIIGVFFLLALGIGAGAALAFVQWS